jgi:hypothetical protein
VSVHSLTRSSYVTVDKAECGQIIGMTEHHTSASGDPTVTVVEAVNRRVVLIVRAQGLQQEHSFRDGKRLT